MNTELLIIFICLNVANVIIQTIKSLATVKCGKTAAALINAVAYGLYTIVTVYMMCELPLFWKAGIVALCNLVGVFVVKWGEEIARKDKLWKVEATIKPEYFEDMKTRLKEKGIAFTFINVEKYYIFNIFCPTQKESAEAKWLLDKHEAKYFVSESKSL